MWEISVSGFGSTCDIIEIISNLITSNGITEFVCLFVVCVCVCVCVCGCVDFENVSLLMDKAAVETLTT
jgi:hypothetical protein